jgi:hypothetical protein
MSRLPLGVLLVVCGAGFAACSGSSNVPDAGPPASDAAVDSAVAADTGPDAPPVCEVGTPPSNVPAALAKIVIEGTTPPPDDAGADASTDAGDAGDAGDAEAGVAPFAAPVGDLPEPTGGDETGTWVYQTLTLYLPAIAGSFIDASQSGGVGKGWIELTGTDYRQSVDFTFLITAQSTKIPAPLKISTKGAYTKAGTDLLLTPVCSDGAPANASTYGFSRISATKLQLRSAMSLQGLTATVVVDLVKR